MSRKGGATRAGWIVGLVLLLAAVGLGRWWFGDERAGPAVALPGGAGLARPASPVALGIDASPGNPSDAGQARAGARQPAASALNLGGPTSRPEGPWTLEFVDAFGDPLGFMELRVQQERTEEQVRALRTGLRRTTDANGRLQLTRGRDLWATVLGIHADVVGLEEPVVLDLSDESLQGDPFVVTMPVGHWQVELRDGQGQPAGGRGSFSFSFEEAAEVPTPPVDTSALFGGRQGAREVFVSNPILGSVDLDGGAVDAWYDVRASESLRVATALAGSRMWVTGASGAVEQRAPGVGPRGAPGRLELPVQRPGLLLRGRLPERFANSDLDVVDLVGASGFVTQGLVRVDERAEFVVSLSTGNIGALHQVHLTGRHAESGVAFGGTIELRPTLAVPGVHDLGLMRVEELPLLSSGWLTWADGTPRGTIRVRLWDEAPEPLRGGMNGRGRPFSNDQVGLGRSRFEEGYTALQAVVEFGLDARLQRGSSHPIVVEQPEQDGYYRILGHWPSAQAVLSVGGIERYPITVGQADVLLKAVR